jgi:hypothetical protein
MRRIRVLFLLVLSDISHTPLCVEGLGPELLGQVNRR